MPANLPIARPAASITATPSAASAQPPLSDTIVGGDGTDRNDLITEAHQVSGYGGSDTIFGTDASDDIAGYDFGQMGAGVDGRDELHGGRGADSMWGNAAADELHGEDGADLLYGARFGSAKQVGDGADLLEGAGGDDVARGNTGSDTLLGGEGDDNLGGQWGSDTVNGGAGHDLASFFMFYEAEALRFNASRFVPGETIRLDDPMGGRDTLISMEELIVTGSAFNDTLTGSGYRDRLIGDNGDDRIDGRGGDDILTAYDGDSTLSGGAGDDILQLYGFSSHTGGAGSGGHDVVHGGEGDDLLYFSDHSQRDAGVVAALGSDGTFALVSGDGELSITGEGIEAVSLNGSAGADHFTGGEGDDWLADVYATYSYANDTLIGGAGDDTLSGGFGSNVIEGGAGNDIYVFYPPGWSDFEPQVLDASGFDVSGGAFTVTTEGGVDTVSGVEGVGLTGGFSQDTLIGSAGNDRLEGDNGNDSIDGGGGDDIIVMDPASAYEDSRDGLDETIRGGGGFDTMSFAGMDVGVRVDLGRGQMSYVDQGNAPVMVGLITGVEAVVGGRHGDTLIGSRGDELLSGLEGADSLVGAAGADTLIGGWGADRLNGGLGRDVFVYNSAQESAVNEADRIAGFTDGDRIDLSGIDADSTAAGDQAFTRVKAFDGHAGQLATDYSLGVTTVSGDVDGDGLADFRIELDGNQKATLDFVL